MLVDIHNFLLTLDPLIFRIHSTTVNFTISHSLRTHWTAAVVECTTAIVALIAFVGLEAKIAIKATNTPRMA